MNDLDNMKQMMLLIESAEQLDEIDFKKAAATAMAVGALAGAPDVDASNLNNIDTGNGPVATQSVSGVSSEAKQIMNKYKNLDFFGSVNGLKYLEASPEGKVYQEISQQLLKGYMDQIAKMPAEKQTGGLKYKAKTQAENNAMILMAKHLVDTNPDHPFVKKSPDSIVKR